MKLNWVRDWHIFWWLSCEGRGSECRHNHSFAGRTWGKPESRAGYFNSEEGFFGEPPNQGPDVNTPLAMETCFWVMWLVPVASFPFRCKNAWRILLLLMVCKKNLSLDGWLLSWLNTKSSLTDSSDSLAPLAVMQTMIVGSAAASGYTSSESLKPDA